MMLKDFSDELIALYEDTEDPKETTTSEEEAKNSIVTVLAAPDLATAYTLLKNTKSEVAG